MLQNDFNRLILRGNTLGRMARTLTHIVMTALCVASLLSTAALPINAESATSTEIVGIVTDQSTGLPVDGATVILWETNDTTTTDASGTYHFLSAPTGGFTLVVGHSGYESLSTFGGCDCGLWGDVDCSNSINPVDVVYLVNYVYKNWDVLCNPPNCPLPTGDVDCGGSLNPVDVVYFVNYVYKNYAVFCANPCGP